MTTHFSTLTALRIDWKQVENSKDCSTCSGIGIKIGRRMESFAYNEVFKNFLWDMVKLHIII